MQKKKDRTMLLLTQYCASEVLRMQAGHCGFQSALTIKKDRM
jgi:hypothetical protein